MKKRLTAIIMAAALMLSAAACSTTSGQNSTASEASVASTASESKETESSDQQASQPEKATSIENWNEDSPAMKSIMAFVEEVTDEKSDKFVPAEKRRMKSPTSSFLPKRGSLSLTQTAPCTVSCSRPTLTSA